MINCKAAETVTMTRLCLDPWTYLEITAKQELKPCCKQDPLISWSPGGPSLDELRDSDGFRNLRNELITGQLNQICDVCHIRPWVPVAKFQAMFQAMLTAQAKLTNGVVGVLDNQDLLHLRLDVTEDCNLRCVYCAVSQPGYSASEMKVESFDEIVKLVSRQPRTLQILFNGHGETIFHREWLKLGNPIVELGFRPQITTNLSMPLKTSEAECLAKFSVIQISLDTVDPDLLKNLRRKVKLATVIENIHKIRTICRTWKQTAPTFAISCGVFDANYAFLEDVAAFCIEFDIRTVTFWQLVKHDDLLNTQNVYPVLSLDSVRIGEAITHMENTISLLNKAGIAVEVPGDFLNEWRKLYTTSKLATPY